MVGDGLDDGTEIEVEYLGVLNRLLSEIGRGAGVGFHSRNYLALDLGRLASSASRMPLKRSSIEILMFSLASPATTVSRRTR